MRRRSDLSKLSVVGIGPGSFEAMTQRARQALADCDVIVGYTVYVELVKAHFADKEFLTTPMRKEVERCSLAFERAAAGQNVAMICSGDAGVYGMSGLIYELSEKYPEVEIEIVPGVSAVISGAAILGAPLMHDFAVISLSDLLTPWEKIEKRLLCAAEPDPDPQHQIHPVRPGAVVPGARMRAANSAEVPTGSGPVT